MNIQSLNSRLTLVTQFFPHLEKIYESTKAEIHSTSYYTPDKFLLEKIVEGTCP